MLLRVFSGFLVLAGCLVAAAGVAAQEICPFTTLASANLDDAHKQREGAIVGPLDAFFISLAELNGYFDGDPKLTFETGRTQLGDAQRVCLRALARTYAGAVKAAGVGKPGAGVGIVVVGHADATGDRQRNNRLSFERASAGSGALSQMISSELGWSPDVKEEGRGGLEPWWCGIEDPTGADPKQPSCASLSKQGSTAASDSIAPQRNDRRLEIRFNGVSVAGPRIDLATKAATVAPTTDIDFQRLMRFEPRMRYFPMGNAPLQPVRIDLGDSVARVCLDRTGDWPVSPWSRVESDTYSTFEVQGATVPAEGGARAPARFDVVNLTMRFRVLPVVGRNGKVERARIVAELATGTVGPLVKSASPEHATVMALSAGGGTTPPILRHAQGYGVPDYWRTRLRIDALLTELLGTETAPKAIWSDISVCPAAATNWQMTAFASRVRESVLKQLPRDFDGLLAREYDFNRTARMFGLRPGLKLRVDTAQLGLKRGETTKYTMALAGSSVEYDLYAAPLALRTNPEVSASSASDARWWSGSGAFGHLAVSLNPTVQGIWADTAKSKDRTHLPFLPDLESAGASRLAFNLANPVALERFLRGRIVSVFLPGGGRQSRMKEIDITTDAEPVHSDNDTILLAAETPDVLLEFGRRYISGKLLAAKTGSACGEDADRVYCGFLRQNVALSLLLPVRARGQARHVPIDTRVGNLLSSGDLQPCFRRLVDKSNPPDADVEPFGPGDRLERPITISAMGAALPKPGLYDRSDCRLLGLPILAEGDLQW